MDRYYAAVFAQLPDIRFVGFSIWTSNYLSTLLAASHLKRRKRPPFIVAGGPQVSESPASADLGLRGHLFDAVAVGEGEHTLLMLYKAFCDGGDDAPADLPGTRWLNRATGVVCASEWPLLPIRELPVPSFEEMDIDAYQIDDWRTLPFHMSRGCTDKCSFCSEWVFWRRFRLDGPEHTVDGIERLMHEYGATYIHFTDSLLNASAARLHDVAEEMLRRRLRVGWGGFMRAQMDAETAALIRQAGCEEVFLGIESFSDDTLELMNKRRTEEDNLRSLRAFLDAGMFVVAGFIPGFPGDSRDAFLHSAKTLRRLQRDYPGQLRVNTEPFRVSPGQPLYGRLAENGLIPTGWDEEYLSIEPELADLTSRIICSVDGDNQGLERIGREKIALMIAADVPVRTDRFVYEGDEEIAAGDFTFEHVFEGWHVALTKSDVGHVLALLVDGDELVELREMALEASPARASLRFQLPPIRCRVASS